MNLFCSDVVFKNFSEETEMIFKAASDLGLTTDEYMWIMTTNVITSSPYVKFDYSQFPIGSLGRLSFVGCF